MHHRWHRGSSPDRNITRAVGGHRVRGRVGTTSSVSVGFGATAPNTSIIEPQEQRRYVAQEHYRRYDLSPLVHPFNLAAAPAFGITTALCITASLTAAAFDVGARYHRELRNREAWEIIGSCILPYAGRVVLHQLLFERPEFDVVYPPRDDSELGGETTPNGRRTDQ